MDIILASTSRYRAALLERLRLEFRVAPPGFDETPLPQEPPEALVRRLAVGKAETVAREHPQAIVIGSDQVAVHGGRIIGKPGSAHRAEAQLHAFSAQRARFLTAVAVVCHERGFHRAHTVATRVDFRELDESEIRRYVARDQPLDCAGGFRAEGLGIALMRSCFSADPTALVGLPLIATADLLRAAGVAVP